MLPTDLLPTDLLADPSLLHRLVDTSAAPHLEPLIVALRMVSCDAYSAPLEVVEVARDVLERIKAIRSSDL